MQFVGHCAFCCASLGVASCPPSLAPQMSRTVHTVSEADEPLWEIASGILTKATDGFARLKQLSLRFLLPAVASLLSKQSFGSKLPLEWECELLDTTSSGPSPLLLILKPLHRTYQVSFTASERTCQLLVASQGNPVALDIGDGFLSKIWSALEQGVEDFISQLTTHDEQLRLSKCDTEEDQDCCSFELDGVRVDVFPTIQVNEARRYVLRRNTLGHSNCIPRLSTIADKLSEIQQHSSQLICALKHASTRQMSLPSGFFESLVYRVFTARNWTNTLPLLSFSEAWCACWDHVVSKPQTILCLETNLVLLEHITEKTSSALKYWSVRFATFSTSQIHDFLTSRDPSSANTPSGPTRTAGASNPDPAFVLFEDPEKEWVGTFLGNKYPTILCPDWKDDIASWLRIGPDWTVVCSDHEPPLDKLRQLVLADRKIVVILLYPESMSIVKENGITLANSESILVTFGQAPDEILDYWILLFLSDTVLTSLVEKIELANFQVRKVTGRRATDTPLIRVTTSNSSYLESVQRNVQFKGRLQISVKVVWVPLCKSLAQLNQLSKSFCSFYNTELFVPDGRTRTSLLRNIRKVDSTCINNWTATDRTACWYYCQRLPDVSQVTGLPVHNHTTFDWQYPQPAFVHDRDSALNCFNDPLTSQLCEHFQSALAERASSSSASSGTDEVVNAIEPPAEVLHTAEEISAPSYLDPPLQAEKELHATVSLYATGSPGNKTTMKKRSIWLSICNRFHGITSFIPSFRHVSSHSFWVTFEVTLASGLRVLSKPAGWIANLQTLGFSKVALSIQGMRCEYSITEYRFRVPYCPPSWIVKAYQTDDSVRIYRFQMKCCLPNVG